MYNIDTWNRISYEHSRFSFNFDWIFQSAFYIFNLSLAFTQTFLYHSKNFFVFFWWHDTHWKISLKYNFIFTGRSNFSVFISQNFKCLKIRETENLNSVENGNTLGKNNFGTLLSLSQCYKVFSSASLTVVQIKLVYLTMKIFAIPARAYLRIVLHCYYNYNYDLGRTR